MRPALLLLLLLAASVPAEAQRTGGRIGGFGGGSSYRGSSYRGSSSSSYRGSSSYGGSSASYGSSSSYGSGSSSYGSGSGSGASAYSAWVAARREAGLPTPPPEERALRTPSRVFGEDSLVQGGIAFLVGGVPTLLLGFFVLGFVDKSHRVLRLSLGFGPEARPALQAALSDLARHASAATPAGREALLKKALALACRHGMKVQYALWQSVPAKRGPGAQRFFALAQDLRSRFKHETVGAHGGGGGGWSKSGGTSGVWGQGGGDGGGGVWDRAAGGLGGGGAHAEEGPGLLVLSALVFTRQRIELPSTLDVGAAVEAFQSLRAPEGLELIWSPSEPGDRMSSAELEVLYPELARLDASVGRVACSHCAAVFARELGTCPACGAPAPAAAA